MQLANPFALHQHTHLRRGRMRGVNRLIIILSLFIGACADLSVYGPRDDYSDMSIDFISESVKRNLRAGQPFGDKGLTQDAYTRFAAMGFDLQKIQRDLQAANAICVRLEVDLSCDAERKWSIVWPKHTRDRDGKLQVERTQPVHALISYRIKSNKDNPTLNVYVKYASQ